MTQHRRGPCLRNPVLQRSGGGGSRRWNMPRTNHQVRQSGADVLRRSGKSFPPSDVRVSGSGSGSPSSASAGSDVQLPEARGAAGRVKQWAYQGGIPAGAPSRSTWAPFISRPWASSRPLVGVRVSGVAWGWTIQLTLMSWGRSGGRARAPGPPKSQGQSKVPAWRALPLRGVQPEHGKLGGIWETVEIQGIPALAVQSAAWRS